MIKKKTTKKKSTSTRKKTTTRKKTKTATAGGGTESGTAVSRGKTAARKPKTVSTPKKKAVKKKVATSRKRRGSAAGRAPQVVTPTEVLEEDGAIVISFPPVAPSPFAGVRASSDREDVHAGAVDPAVAPEPREELPEPEPEPEPKPEAEAPRPARERRSAEVESERLLSPSQKRRLRRRRSKPKQADKADAEEDKGAAAAKEMEVDARGDDEDADPALAAAELIEAADSATSATGDLETPVERARPAGEVAGKEKGRRRRRRGRRSAQHEVPEGAEAAEVVKPAEAKRGAAKAAKPAEAKRTAAKPAEAKRGAGAAKPVREMIINAVPREECRIAVLQGGKLEEIYFERATSENHVGNIYKGVVTNVEASIQAAFIDFGQGKNGFLHVSDLHPEYFPDGAGQTENVGHKLPRRHRPPIQRCLRRGREVLVQVIKEGIGTKGPTLSTYLSIPGRFLVMMPGMRRLGVSRRIEDDEARDRLRTMLGDLDLPEGMGFIARTAALDHTKRELQSDLGYLSRLWRAVEKRIKDEPAPAELYRESDLVIRTIRDVFTTDVGRIIVDDPEVAKRAREFLAIFSPRSRDTVELHDQPVPIFHAYDIELELERLHSRHVPLKSGGSLVIDQTEALVAVDVNSGRFRSESDAEQTAYKINIEAADEIPRQLRLRDLGGVVVCDFIDMRMESHRRDIERRMARNLKEHKERAKVLRMSAFGIIELTRQRQRPSLTRSVYQDCRHCRGSGLVKSVESVALDVMRLTQLAVSREHIQMIEISVSPDVAFLLQNRKRRLVADLEREYRRTISIRPEPRFSLDQVEIRCTDARGRVVPQP